ncbi:hypothetical protein C5167_048295 [Papaver somniferum]|uniref:Uncharacterized protein n=1 Tax=Papaver somniferum TaxID=3469 RepID=A0A4Y7KHJ2_PAPSO|nr:hypothetical protein C5167_048295 [Papaver somniferum]
MCCAECNSGLILLKVEHLRSFSKMRLILNRMGYLRLRCSNLALTEACILSLHIGETDALPYKNCQLCLTINMILCNIEGWLSIAIQVTLILMGSQAFDYKCAIGSGDISIEGAQNVEGEEANGARESETKDGLTQCVVFEAIEYCVARFAHFSPPEHEILVPSLIDFIKGPSVQDGEKYVDQLPSDHPDSSSDKSELQKLPMGILILAA